MKLTLTLFFACLSVICFGQKVRYLNANHTPVNFKDQATFYTETFEDGPQAGIVKTYTLAGVLLSEEAYSNLKRRTLHGITRNYYPNGKLKAEINFKDGVLNGPLRTFYPNERIKRAELFEKGNAVQGKCFSRAGYDTTYTSFQTIPEFKGGHQALFTYLQSKSRYPIVAVDEALIQKGFVAYAIVKFVVDTEGKISDVVLSRSISDFTIPRSAGAPYDREAIRLVTSMPSWEPGKQDGENTVSEHYLVLGFR